MSICWDKTVFTRCQMNKCLGTSRKKENISRTKVNGRRRPTKLLKEMVICRSVARDAERNRNAST